MSTTVTGRPGVTVTESLIPLTTTSTTPGQALAAFVGGHNAGPVGPTLISSWSQYLNVFGGFGSTTDYLSYAVYEFFANGGAQCYVVRAVPSDSTYASVVLNDLGTGGAGGTTPEPLLTLTAIAPGSTGNQLYVDVIDSAAADGTFTLYIRVGSATATPTEIYTNVTLNPSGARNLVQMINAANGAGSQLVTAVYTGSTTAWTSKFTPATQSGTPLTGAIDGVAALNLVTATQLLNNVDGILVINLPGTIDPTVINPLVAWAIGRGDRFMVVDSPTAQATYANTVTTFENVSPLGASTGSPYTQSSYIAVYGPWLNFADPSSRVVGATRLLPPGGAILGLMSRADATAGTQQAPAGVNYPIAGAVSPQVVFQSSDLDALNQLGVNIIRTVPGQSALIPMGARTLTSGMPDRYIPVRRTLMYLTRLCVQATQFAVFRPNNQDLWNQLTSILTDQLTALQQAGVLQGSTAAQAFFVTCDTTNNTANSIANGIVNITVGVSLQTPAEYIVIQIGQMASGATVSTSLTS